jgi:disulfide oxidoreductase YuzD
MTILILSAACCFPSQAAIDEQAKKVVELAIHEAGVSVEVLIVPGSTAIYSKSLPKHTKDTLMRMFGRNELGPAIVINGEIVACGVPKLEEIKEIIKKTDSK